MTKILFFSTGGSAYLTFTAPWHIGAFPTDDRGALLVKCRVVDDFFIFIFFTDLDLETPWASGWRADFLFLRTSRRQKHLACDAGYLMVCVGGALKVKLTFTCSCIRTQRSGWCSVNVSIRVQSKNNCCISKPIWNSGAAVFVDARYRQSVGRSRYLMAEKTAKTAHFPQMHLLQNLKASCCCSSI